VFVKKSLGFILVVSFVVLQSIFAESNLKSSEVKASSGLAQVGASSSSQLVRIQFKDFDQLRLLTSLFDVWEVHSDLGYLLAYVQPDEVEWLAANGYQVQADRRLSNLPDTIPAYPCYRTIDELDADLGQIAAQYPSIAELISIGKSYEGQQLFVLRLTNRKKVGKKPVFFLMANIHGREVITPEVAMSFIERLVQNYNQDADITWLLDSTEIQVLVSANPDGHVKNEAGQPWTYWRKNTHPYGACSLYSYGVDLNRNYDFKWGCCGGSSGNACYETYRGPAAASEPEAQALQDYLLSQFPDMRGPGDLDAAPLDTPGLLITLHSYGNLVLWPWGWTTGLAPNNAGLSALGRKLASFNHYVPEQSIDLYPTDGATDDWSYGELGIASYTFEIGSGNDGFYPSCSRYDALIQPNLSALEYAAKVVRSPYLTSHGPDASQISLLPMGQSSALLSLTAWIDDTQNGLDGITAAEYYIDKPPWEGGVPASFLPQDGHFDQVQEAVQALVSLDGLSPGRHMVYVRGKDSAGYWGPFTAEFFWSSLITGRVSESITDLPISDALVALAGDRFLTLSSTDAAGFYIASVPGGTYTTTVSASGYISKSLPGILVGAGDTVMRDFTLAPVNVGRGLRISLNGPAGPVPPWGLFSYNLLLTNISTESLSGVGASDILPSQVTPIETTPPGLINGSQVSWSGFKIAPGQTVSFSFRVRVKPGVPLGTLIYNKDYEAWAEQITGKVRGDKSVITLVSTKGNLLFLPMVGRNNLSKP